jgi:type IV pilus assembly protein PilM
MTEHSLSAASPRNPAQRRVEVLGERALAASPSTPNLLKPQLYRDALHRLCAGNGAKRSTSALVIPDYAARMAILDFEEFPPGADEQAALLRFRLRKSVPFHIDEAQLAYSVQSNEPKRVEVLAVAIARPILNEYEALFTDAGFRVGLVTPSSIATLRLCDSSVGRGLTLLAKAAGHTLSVLLLEQGRLRLARCLDLSDEENSTRQLSADVIIPFLRQTLAYAEDEIGVPVEQLLLCGFGAETESLGRIAESEFGVRYGALRSRFGPALQDNAGLLGLLEQYVA